MKEATFVPTRKPRDPVNKVATYKQIDPTYVDDIAEWQVILL